LLSSPGAKIITPSDSDIVPPGEIGEFYAGPLPSKPVPPQPVSSAEVQARAARVNNDRSALSATGLRPAGGEPWRSFVGGTNADFFWGGATGRRDW